MLAQVQINHNLKNDTFTELPVSLVLFSLICIDVVERIRQCRLTGQGKHSTTLHCTAQNSTINPSPTHSSSQRTRVGSFTLPNFAVTRFGTSSPK